MDIISMDDENQNFYRSLVDDLHSHFHIYNEEYSQKEHQEALITVRNELVLNPGIEDVGPVINDFLAANDEFDFDSGIYSSTDFLNALAQNKEMQDYMRKKLNDRISQELVEELRISAEKGMEELKSKAEKYAAYNSDNHILDKALYSFCENSLSDAFEMLLDCGADATYERNYKDMPENLLHWAASDLNDSVIHILNERLPEEKLLSMLCSKNADGMTPLEVALMRMKETAHENDYTHIPESVVLLGMMEENLGPQKVHVYAAGDKFITSKPGDIGYEVCLHGADKSFLDNIIDVDSSSDFEAGLVAAQHYEEIGLLPPHTWSSLKELDDNEVSASILASGQRTGFGNDENFKQNKRKRSIISNFPEYAAEYFAMLGDGYGEVEAEKECHIDADDIHNIKEYLAKNGISSIIPVYPEFSSTNDFCGRPSFGKACRTVNVVAEYLSPAELGKIKGLGFKDYNALIEELKIAFPKDSPMDVRTESFFDNASLLTYCLMKEAAGGFFNRNWKDIALGAVNLNGYESMQAFGDLVSHIPSEYRHSFLGETIKNSKNDFVRSDLYSTIAYNSFKDGVATLGSRVRESFNNAEMNKITGNVHQAVFEIHVPDGCCVAELFKDDTAPGDGLYIYKEYDKDRKKQFVWFEQFDMEAGEVNVHGNFDRLIPEVKGALFEAVENSVDSYMRSKFGGLSVQESFFLDIKPAGVYNKNEPDVFAEFLSMNKMVATEPTFSPEQAAVILKYLSDGGIGVFVDDYKGNFYEYNSRDIYSSEVESISNSDLMDKVRECLAYAKLHESAIYDAEDEERLKPLFDYYGCGRQVVPEKNNPDAFEKKAVEYQEKHGVSDYAVFRKDNFLTYYVPAISDADRRKGYPVKAVVNLLDGEEKRLAVTEKEISAAHEKYKLGSVSKRYLDKVKELLPSQDRNDVEKILIAGQKILSTFDECDKSYISRYLSSLGASSPDKLGRVLNSAISGKKNPEREIDQRNEGR